jgi:3-phosphoshikimate 1-carboxyvinyltransferase
MIRLSHPSKILKGTISLPSSKSVSNRVLILQKLYEPELKIDNLSDANDTKLLQDILRNESTHLDVQDAGTAFRFLVAYCAVRPGVWTIQGSNRLHERPIQELVELLQILGADITYLESPHYAPLRIIGKPLKANFNLDVRHVKSSQFVSALLMIAPKIEGDFKLVVDSSMNSYSYIALTIEVMRNLGFKIDENENSISVSKEKKSSTKHFKVEPDWSSFYYWYAMAYLSESCNLDFPGLNMDNLSQEKNAIGFVANSDVDVDISDNDLHIKRTINQSVSIFKSKYNFSQYPDLAPTFAFLLPTLGCRNTRFYGLESLQFKECDREEAVGQQLERINVQFEKQNDFWTINADDFMMYNVPFFDTYSDHRMAMSVAPLALLGDIIVEDETVVKKSYPDFWEDLKKVGFEIVYL